MSLAGSGASSVTGNSRAPCGAEPRRGGSEARAYRFQYTFKHRDSELPELAELAPPSPDLGVTFCTGQWEVNDDDLIFFNGYVEFKRKVSAKHVRLFVKPSTAVLASAEITNRDFNIAAVTRKEQRWPEMLIPFVFGKSERAAPGEATKDLWANIRAMLIADPSTEGIRAVARLYPDIYVKHSTGIAAIALLMDVPARAPEPALRPWQADTLKMLIDPATKAVRPAHPRHIHILYGREGNSGKSFLSDILVRNYNAIMFDGQTRTIDMAFMYQKQRIAIFDIPRGADVTVLNDVWKFCESLKNGMVNSSKYVSALKVFPVPWVIIFCNTLPPSYVWTADRYRVTALSGAPPEFYPSSVQHYGPGVEHNAIAEEIAIQAAAAAAAAPPPLALHDPQTQEPQQADPAATQTDREEGDEPFEEGGCSSERVKRARAAYLAALEDDRRGKRQRG